MPSAAPVPRGPSVLALGSAADLLTRPGCPVCRYAGEASDRYLAWFALEAHADPVMITRLRASLGMCARHTRQLIDQPGAATRLTAVYRYVLEAAREQLAGKGTRLATCPACEHDQAAAGRALGMLLDELSEPGIQGRYLEAGGLCWPHVLSAVSGKGHRRLAAWLMQAVPPGITGHRASLDLLAGRPDHDATERARLRAALPLGRHFPPGTCVACLTAARAELAGLARATGTGCGHQPEGAVRQASRPGLPLCAGHLRDATLMGGANVAALLSRQAECQAAALAQLQPAPWQRRGKSAGWLRGRRSTAVADQCPICRARNQAAQWELQRHVAGPEDAPGGRRGGQPLCCARHVLALRASDPAAGQVAAAAAARRADVLIEELADAFRKGTWASRHESRGPEMTAWRRAVAFLDGAVFGGGPPGQ
jgi:hypothetical protein